MFNFGKKKKNPVPEPVTQPVIPVVPVEPEPIAPPEPAAPTAADIVNQNRIRANQIADDIGDCADKLANWIAKGSYDEAAKEKLTTAAEGIIRIESDFRNIRTMDIDMSNVDDAIENTLIYCSDSIMIMNIDGLLMGIASLEYAATLRAKEYTQYDFEVLLSYVARASLSNESFNLSDAIAKLMLQKDNEKAKQFELANKQTSDAAEKMTILNAFAAAAENIKTIDSSISVRTSQKETCEQQINTLNLMINGKTVPISQIDKAFVMELLKNFAVKMKDDLIAAVNSRSNITKILDESNKVVSEISEMNAMSTQERTETEQKMERLRQAAPTVESKHAPIDPTIV